MTNLDSIWKNRDIVANKGPSSQSYSFSSSHVWIWELDYKESWVLKNWCFWTVVLEKTLESPVDCKIKPVIPKGNQPWVFIGRTDWCWSRNSNILATSCEMLTHWKKTLILGKILGKKRRAGQRIRWLEGTTIIHWTREVFKVKDKEAWHTAVHGVAKSWTPLSDWTAITCSHLYSWGDKTQGKIV